jgi:hypothetical protein
MPRASTRLPATRASHLVSGAVGLSLSQSLGTVICWLETAKIKGEPPFRRRISVRAAGWRHPSGERLTRLVFPAQIQE